MMVDELSRDFRTRAYGYVSAALGLVAGLAWNEAIKSLIESVFQLAKDTVLVKFLYALAVTVVVVVLIRYLDGFFKKRANES